MLIRLCSSVGQMVMGFVLPFALVFVAIPLESFIQSSRTVLGVATAIAMRLVAAGFGLLATAFEFAGKLLVDIYDIVIFAPLWIETQFRSVRAGARKGPGDRPAVNEAVS